MASREPLTQQNALMLVEELERLVRASGEDDRNLAAAETAHRILSSLEAGPVPADRIRDKLASLDAWTEVMFRDRKHAGPGSLKGQILRELSELRSLLVEEA